MKKFSILILFLVVLQTASAQKYMTRNGYIGFFSHTPMEDIKADNNQVASVLDTSTGEMVFQVLMKSFKFDRSLMEEHFNENYLESDKFPKSTFSGKIVDFASIDFSKPGKHDVNVSGDLTIHGTTKQIEVPGTIEIEKGMINAKSKFVIKPEDFNIEIPGVVREKIAKEFEVTVEIKYSEL